MKFLYPQFKKKACTFSFDDGVTQDIRLIEIFDKYKLKSTFNLNSGFMGNEGILYRDNRVVMFDKIKAKDVRETYKNHEIAIHGVRHPHLEFLPSMEMYWHIAEDCRRLSELAGYYVNGMAYPFGTYNENVVKALGTLGILYSRTVDDTYDFMLPENYLLWNPTCQAIKPQLDDIGERFLKTDTERAALYIWGHAFEFDQTDQWDRFNDFCKNISGREEIWYCTNADLAVYDLAIRKCKIENKVIKNPTDTDIFFEDNGKQYIIPARQIMNLGENEK